MKILLLQGANMVALGKRQPELYGTTTAAELDALLLDQAKQLKVSLDIRYTNVEGKAIDWIYEADQSGIDGLLFNPAGFAYAGYALRDCLKAVALPCIEVHMTNLERRGMHSVTADAVDGVIMGLGIHSYVHGLRALVRLIHSGQGG
ncbi:MAG: type II 3-dehydroquinate dehydratase [Burkholderiales bacterium]|nr:type II 3-dehydroquinate dehydratase [Burkholderiales bacterium]